MDEVAELGRTKPVTRKYLKKRFKAVLDELNDAHDGAALIARRHQVDVKAIEQEIQIDLAYSWSYRLLMTFGRRTSLAFDGTCPARAWLRSKGVSEPVIQHMAAGVHQTLVMESNSPGYMEQFKKSLVADDRDASIPSIERAIDADQRARAQAFSEVDERYGLSVPAQAADKDDTSSKERAFDDAGTNAVSEPALAGVPLAEMPSTIDNFLARHAEAWNQKTRNQARQTVDLFLRVLTEHRVRSSDEIKQRHLGAFRDLLGVVPPRYGQTPRLRVLEAAELRREGERLRAFREAAGLSSGTIARHLEHLGAYLAFLHGQGWLQEVPDVGSLRPKRRKGTSARSLTAKHSIAEMGLIFTLPPFTGCESQTKLGWPGARIFHSGPYFAPMAMVYLGMRRLEICGLGVDDVRDSADGWIFDVADNVHRGVKTAPSQRILPVPKEMIRLGFVEYRDAIKGLGYDVLFPDLYRSARDNDPGDRLYDVLDASRKRFQKLGQPAPEWKRLLHTFRNSAINAMKQAGVEEAARRDIAGHQPIGTNERHYTDTLNVAAMREIIDALPCVTEHLEPLPIRLLPWVQDKAACPWERPRKG